MAELQSHYCEETGCIRKVFYPHLYCDKHVDRASDPRLIDKMINIIGYDQKLDTWVISHDLLKHELGNINRSDLVQALEDRKREHLSGKA